MRKFLVQLFLTAALLVPATDFSFAAAREPGWDRPGLDYRSFDLRRPRDYLCSMACRRDYRCRAWTYVRPGVQGPRARCWLKYAVPAPVRNNCCISGTK
jgi:hypothetical protein